MTSWRTQFPNDEHPETNGGEQYVAHQPLRSFAIAFHKPFFHAVGAHLTFGMKAASFLIWVALSGAALAQSEQSAAVERSEALHSETIPHLMISKAAIDEALAVVRRIWEQKHPNEPFPVGITSSEVAGAEGRATQPLITLDLKNVPYIVALRSIAILGDFYLKEKSGFVQLERIAGKIVEDWSTETYELTQRVRDALGLRFDSTPTQVQTSFEKFGVKFEQGMMAALDSSGKLLSVRNMPRQQHQIAGIVLLLENGYEIKKLNAEPAGADQPATRPETKTQ
ncbi:MAG: hypothetical protein ACKV19_21500 [Verrucomicrobiales bacterium]